MILNAQRKKVNAMANNNVNKEKETLALQRMMEGMRNIWEPICGNVEGGKRKTRRNRSNRKNKTSRNRR